MSRGYDTLESGSSHGTTTHRELCQAALVPLQSWLLVYPTLILKLVLTALLFAFAPLSLIAFVQAVISIVFLYLVVYRRIVMEGVVNFIDLIRIHKAEEHSPLEEVRREDAEMNGELRAECKQSALHLCPLFNGAILLTLHSILSPVRAHPIPPPSVLLHPPAILLQGDR